MDVDWFWTLIYLTAGFLSVVYSRGTKCVPLAIALLISIILSAGGALVVPAEGMPAVYVIAEVIVMGTAAAMLIETPRISTIIIALATLSCIVSLVYSIRRDAEDTLFYEETINAILLIELALVMNARILSALGIRFDCFRRWRRHRRRAVDAACGMGVEARPVAKAQLMRAVRGIWLHR